MSISPKDTLFFVCQEVLKKHSSCVVNVWTIWATEHFSKDVCLPASFVLATQKIPVNMCKLFFREGVLLLRLKHFRVCLKNSVKL